MLPLLGIGSDGNEGVIRIPQSSSINGTSASYCLVSYPGHTLGGSYPCVGVQSVYSTTPADWVSDQVLIFVIVYYFQIWNKKEHNIINSRDILYHMSHVYWGVRYYDIVVHNVNHLSGYVLLEGHLFTVLRTLRNFWVATKALQDHSQFLSAHWIERVGKVHKHYIQSFVLLLVLLLEPSEDKHYVCDAPFGSEPTLGFW